MTELKDWLNSINQTKKNLIDEDPDLEKDYPPNIINRSYSGQLAVSNTHLTLPTNREV